MLPYSMIAGGTFTVPVTGGVAAGVNVQCIAQNPPDYVVARAITNWGVISKARSIEWWWERSMGNGTARGILQSSEGSTPQLPAMTAYCLPSIVANPLLDAITCYDTSSPPTFAGLAATAITGTAGTFVVSMTNTGTISVGDYVRLVNVVGEEQISTYTFQVTAVTVNTSITLGYMATSGITFAADSTAATVVKIIPQRFYPKRRYIANITVASQAKVYFTETNDFTPGEKVGFRVTSSFGMSQINYIEGRVLTVTNTATESSIVTDINSSGFTAFAFPTSANVLLGNSSIPAICVPSTSAVVPFAGSATVAQQPPGTNLLDAFDNRNTRIIRFGAALFNVSGHVADNGETWCWRAFKYDDYQTGGV
jgi:hypothetical protein